jgi:hypothetical protein
MSKDKLTPREQWLMLKAFQLALVKYGIDDSTSVEEFIGWLDTSSKCGNNENLMAICAPPR